MPELDLDPGSLRERRKRRERRELWRTVGLWAIAIVAAFFVGNAAQTGGLFNFAASITFILILAFGYVDRSIRELWRQKADKRPEDIYDE